jgi:hypothetical protein
MPKVAIYDSPSVTVWFHPESNIVHSHVHKFVSGKEFQDFLMAGYNALVKNKSTKWLSDDKSNSVLRKEDVDWGNANWFPKCVAAGWKYWAIVQPEKVLAHAPMERLVEDFKKFGVTSKFFSDTTAALAWLEKQQ